MTWWSPAKNALALAIGLAACGTPEGPRYPALGRRLVVRIDGDQNGRVEAAEWNARSLPGVSVGPGSFEALDADASGHLDAVELERAFLEIDPAAMQARLRAEARGKVAGAEGPAASIPGPFPVDARPERPNRVPPSGQPERPSVGASAEGGQAP
jgi:hypothetical protein